MKKFIAYRGGLKIETDIDPANISENSTLDNETQAASIKNESNSIEKYRQKCSDFGYADLRDPRIHRFYLDESRKNFSLGYDVNETFKKLGCKVSRSRLNTWKLKWDVESKLDAEGKSDLKYKELTAIDVLKQVVKFINPIKLYKMLDGRVSLNRLQNFRRAATKIRYFYISFLPFDFGESQYGDALNKK